MSLTFQIRPTMATVLDWQSALSPGQKQRMAFARLLYHSPQYAVLDECTNGIQPDVELDLYNRFVSISYVSAIFLILDASRSVSPYSAFPTKLS